MKLLVDMMPSTNLVEGLRNAGHDAVHVRECGPHQATTDAGRESRRASQLSERGTMPMRARIPVDERALAAFCQRHHIRRLAMFGSVLRDDFRPNSDVDVLVEFEPGHVPGYSFIAVQDELSELLGRRVDLHTPASLSQHFRDAVVRDAEVHYAAASPA